MTYYAIVHPEGGTFSWGLNILGANNAIKLVGPLDQSTVQVQALQNKFSANQGDQIIQCDYTYTDPLGNSTTISATFNITVAKPTSLLTIDPGTTTYRDNFVTRFIKYQLRDQFHHNLQNVYSFTNGSGLTISVRVANLLVGEDLDYVVGPPSGHTPTNNGAVSDAGQFTDEIQLSFPQDWTIDQWWYCHITTWTEDNQDTGNLVRTNIITVDSGTPEINIRQIRQL